MGVTDSRSLWGSGAGGWRVAFRVLHEVFFAFVIVLSYNRFVNPCEIKYDILGRKGLLAKEFSSSVLRLCFCLCEEGLWA